MDKPTLSDVEQFWNENPLFTGEVTFDESNPSAFFDSHDNTYFNDVLAGIDLQNTFYFPASDDRVLDLGCGIGFWSSLFVSRFFVANLTSADLTLEALRLCKLRVPSTLVKKENAEKLSFVDNQFSHINCQGVIHHTPNTQSCLDEIYRVLDIGGTASVSVYYKNPLLNAASFSMPLVKVLAKLFLKNKGRGRDFSNVKTLDDLVRCYDGYENPIGKAYSKSEFEQMLRQAGFSSIQFEFFFFPFRFFRFKFPNFLCSALVSLFPFMIVANLKK